MIPKTEYIRDPDPRGHPTCVTYKMIQEYHTEAEAKQFDGWFFGQTACMLPKSATYPKGAIGIYVWDYERWVRQGKETSQRAEDWD